MKLKIRSSRAVGTIAAIAGLAVPLAVSTPASATTTNYSVSNNCNTTNTSDCWSQTNVLFVNYSPVDSNGYTGSGSAYFLGNVANYNYDTTAADGIVYYYNYVFGGGGAGTGQGVRNDAASVLACSSNANYRVYYSQGYQGSSQYIPGDWGCNNGVNLASWLRNENASQHWA